MSALLNFNRKSLVKLGLTAMLAVAPALAEARVGNGSSSGSRGARTQAAPAPTQTAPNTAQPMQRTTTPQTAPTTAARPPAAAPAPAAGGFFGGAFGRGLLGGLVGAGLIGMFMGNGFGGGLGGMMSFIGLILQVGLIVMLAMLAWSFFARRRNPEATLPSGGMQRQAMGAGPQPMSPQGSGVGGLAGAAPQAPQTTPIKIGEQDFGAFERLLAETQAAYSNEDIATLRRLATEEMIYYFRDDIEASKKKGVGTRVSDVKLLQGDLSEAWREGADEYATGAMRFSLIDLTVDRATGRVVDGDANRPVEVTEVWTFVRHAGKGPDAWQLSAIQQTA